jgi:hypothetical protein
MTTTTPLPLRLVNPTATTGIAQAVLRNLLPSLLLFPHAHLMAITGTAPAALPSPLRLLLRLPLDRMLARRVLQTLPLLRQLLVRLQRLGRVRLRSSEPLELGSCRSLSYLEKSSEIAGSSVRRGVQCIYTPQKAR